MKENRKLKIRKRISSKKKTEEEGTSPNWAMPGAQNQPEQASARTPSLCSSFSFFFFSFHADRWAPPVSFLFNLRPLLLTGN
jgi:hypothetical protein